MRAGMGARGSLGGRAHRRVCGHSVARCGAAKRGGGPGPGLYLAVHCRVVLCCAVPCLAVRAGMCMCIASTSLLPHTAKTGWHGAPTHSGRSVAIAEDLFEKLRTSEHAATIYRSRLGVI